MMAGPVFLGFQRREDVAFVLFEQAERCAEMVVLQHSFVVVQQGNVRPAEIHRYKLPIVVK